jgi:hypothetical protein
MWNLTYAYISYIVILWNILEFDVNVDCIPKIEWNNVP